MTGRRLISDDVGARRLVRGVCRVLGATVLAAACHGRSRGECARLAEAGEHQRAVETCERRFAESRDPRDGVYAARALLALGRDDEVLAWVDRLRQTDEEATVLSLRASVYQKRGDTARAEGDLRRALELERAAGHLK